MIQGTGSSAAGLFGRSLDRGELVEQEGHLGPRRVDGVFQLGDPLHSGKVPTPRPGSAAPRASGGRAAGRYAEDDWMGCDLLIARASGCT
jgi:hypothetical protein